MGPTTERESERLGSQQNLAPGTELGGYRVSNLLAAGGMGEVYRAEHAVLGRTAAVKILKSQFSNNATMVQRFFIEAKAASVIAHPGIVEIYDVGRHSDGRAYLVMELLLGEELGRRMRSARRFSELQTVVVARSIANALAAAHGAGIVHRDLKPDNVYLVPDADVESGERAKILDFGVAKLIDGALGEFAKTQTGALMGTPLYMAPEQARAAASVDHRADLYSLGCIMFEMLTGKPPFVADGAGEIIAMQMFSEPDSLHTRLSSCSPQLDTIIQQLLAKDPNDRFTSSGDLIHALDGLPTLAAQLADLLAVPARRGSMMVPMPDLALPPTKVDVPVPAQLLKTAIVVTPSKSSSSAAMMIGSAVAVAVIAVAAWWLLQRTSNELERTTPVSSGSASIIDSKPKLEPHVEPSLRRGTLVWAGKLAPTSIKMMIDGVQVSLTTDGQAEIVLDGKMHSVELSAPGYVTRQFEQKFNADVRLDVDLVKTSKPTGPRGPTTANGSPVEIKI
jgi:serine/threonine protein kinase